MRVKASVYTRVLQVVVAGAIAFPLIWMLGVSLKPSSEPFSSPAQLWPDSMTFDNYLSSLRPEFQTYFLNSLVISGATVAIAVTLGLLGAYGLLQSSRRVRWLIFPALVVGQMVPAASIIIPLFAMVRGFGLLDTHLALILAYIALTLPLATVMNYAFMRSIPRDIIEAATVDGASTFRTFFHIVLPLSIPGVVATSMWLTVVVWQEFLFALAMTTSKDMRTLPVGLNDFLGQYGIRYGELMATSLVMSVPVIVMFLILQRYFVQGLLSGATKG
jgi:multiple sugar transport system permease protein/raffinose/stachyose/melibiose transport system permease protein